MNIKTKGKVILYLNDFSGILLGLRRIGFPWMGDCGTLNTTRLYVTIRIIVIIISIILVCARITI